VWYTGDGLGHEFITLTVDICVQRSGHKSLCRMGLSVAAETFLNCDCMLLMIHIQISL